MSTFARYLRSAQDAINQVEREIALLWEERLREIEEREARLRAVLLGILLLWPFDSKGRVRRGREFRGEVRRLRLQAERLVHDWERGLVSSFSGSPDGWRSVSRSSTRSYFEQTRHLHIYEAAARGRQAATRMELALLGAEGPRLITGREAGKEPGIDREVPGAPSPTEPQGFVDFDVAPDDPRFPSAPTPEERAAADAQAIIDLTEDEEKRIDQLRRLNDDLDLLFGDDRNLPGFSRRLAEQLLQKVSELQRVLDLDPEMRAFLERISDLLLDIVSGDELSLSEDQVDDLVDLLEAALDNPEGNIEDRSRQIQEKLRDLSYDSTVTRAQVIEEINGSARPNATRFASGPGALAGVKLNRNRMRLSVQAHARAALRLELQRLSERIGAGHAVLEVPAPRRKDIKPSGAIARHAHQVRTIDEWSAIYREAGLQKFGTGTSLMGLHHGDFSYLVPVPAAFLTAALEHQKRSRGRLERALAQKEAA